MGKEQPNISWYQEHESLFSDTGLKLGRTLWYLLYAAQEIDTRSHIISAEDGGRNLAEFGKEIGKDEIYWWIYKKETRLEELQAKVQKTLLSLQELKESANQLEPSDIRTYSDLVTTLVEFTKAHEKQIEDLYEFTVWMNRRDILSPAILFTYRVWGSTRISDRWVQLQSKTESSEPTEVIFRLTEIAYGVFKRYTYTRHSVEMDIGSEMYDSDPENYRSQEIPESYVITRTSYNVLREFSIFFEELRDSLRNIQLDIEKCLAEKNLLKSESFWREFITKSKDPGRTESTLWDFKESLEMWHAPGTEKSRWQIDFCKLVAGFANSEGGVIIIGITNDTRDIVGVSDLENRMKSTSDVIKRWIDYPRKDLIFHLQPVPFDQAGKVIVCLVVAIAQTSEVVRVKGESDEYYYPDRNQTGISYPQPRELETRKMHLKAGDNFGFIKELNAFIQDK